MGRGVPVQAAAQGAAQGSVTFTMRVDAADLRRLMGLQQQQQQQAQPQHGQGQGQGHGAPVWKQILLLEGIERGVGGLMRNSQIANTYQAAMGKLFGAAVDALLMPFIPLLNLVVVGMGRLVTWLLNNETWQKLGPLMERVADNLGDVAAGVKSIAEALRSPGKLPGELGRQAGRAVGYAKEHPVEAAATLITGAVMARMAMSALLRVPVVGGMLRMGGQAVGAAARWGYRTVRPGARAAGPATAGPGGAAGGANTALMAAPWVRAGAMALGGWVAGQMAAWGLDRTGAAKRGSFASDAAKYGLTGAGVGAAVGTLVPIPGVGTGVGALVGTGLGVGYAGAKHLWGGGGERPSPAAPSAGGGPGAVQVTNSNSNNTVTINQTVNLSGGPASQEAISSMAASVLDSFQRATGFSLGTRGAPTATQVAPPSRDLTSQGIPWPVGRR